MSLRRALTSLSLALAFIGALPCAQAAVQTSESFDSTAIWTNGFPSSYTDTTNMNGWIINSAVITNDSSQSGYPGNTPSATNVVKLQNSSANGQVITPVLSNGVGTVTFWARLLQTSTTNRMILEGSSGASWVSLGITNNIITNGWTCFTNSILSTNVTSLRLRKLNFGAGAFVVFLDSISVTYPPATIAVTNLVTAPTRPVENDAIGITAYLSLKGYPDSRVATNYWKPSASTNWSAIPMSTNQLDVFTTVTNIPGQAVFTPIDYFVQVTHTSDGISFTANSTTNTYTVQPRSSFTNMVITSPISASLTLSSNYLWQGVAYVSNTVNAFRFQGTSNGMTTLWGDGNQTLSNNHAYGVADAGAPAIILSTVTTGLYVFTFNESTLDYTARPCTYENFEAWTNQPFGTTTNSTTKWILSGGAISNDASGAFLGSGHYATLNGQQAAYTNSFLTSPTLSNGIGDISFWYRKAGTNNTMAGILAVQVAPSPTSTNWTTLATISNILSPAYVFATIPSSDLNNQAVRLTSNPNGGFSQLNIDEVVVAAPGAGVLAANLTNSPAVPQSLDAVNIAIDLTTNAFGTITNALVWYRGGSNLTFQSLSLALGASNHYAAVSTIPPYLGTVQYAVQYFFTGPRAQSPLFFPPGGTNQPYSYTTTSSSIPLDYRYETFDSTGVWTNGFPSSYTDATNVNGWVINASVITNDASQSGYPGYTPSSPNVAKLQNSNLNAQVTSPFLSNGVGSVVFSARLLQASTTNRMILEGSYGPGTNWFPLGYTNNITSTSWTSYTNTVSSTNMLSIRLRKLNYGTGGFVVFLDSIYCTPYPSIVAVSNLCLNPGYPAAGGSVAVSCDVNSLNPNFPAFSLSPTLYWYPYGGVTSSIPMTLSSGKTYLTTSPLSLASITRGWPVAYWVSCAFAGYNAVPADNLSPRSSATNTFITQAFQGSYSNLTGVIGGSNATARLVTNGVWQSIISVGSAGTNSFLLQGYGYSSGSGYSTSIVSIGNATNWQSMPPLADTGVTGQPPLNVTFSNAQYMVRYDESTGQYLVLRCAWQDFDNGVGDGVTYKGTFVGSGAGGSQLIFDDWPLDVSYTRSEDFSGSPWNGYTTFTNGVGGGTAYLIYNSRYVSANSESIQTYTNIPNDTYSFIVQASHWGNNPLHGIGQVSYSYLVGNTNIPVTLGTFIAHTNFFPEPDAGGGAYTLFQDYAEWSINTNFMPLTGVTNKTFLTNSVMFCTNGSFDIVFAQSAGTQSVYYGNVSVSDWFSNARTNDSSGWTLTGYYIETNNNGNGNCCRLDTTRTDTPTNQCVVSPLIAGGIKYVQFNYSGTTFTGSPTNNATSFRVEIATNSPGNWVLLDAISTNMPNNLATTYYTYKRDMNTTTPNLYIRIKNTTARPGALLLDNISIPGYATSNDWSINNVAVHYRDQQAPPAVRQYYRGVAYLNNTRATNNMGTGTEFPNTNTYPFVRTPLLPEGIGEISFWYRNWTTNTPVTPARIVVQAALYDSESYWSNGTVSIITNVVNTNDYAYFRLSLYDTSNRYVRIYNDDQYTNSPSRICLDDILVTAPLASSFVLTNLTITPGTPSYTDTVDIAVDMYRAFYNPLVRGMTGYYAVASSYAALSGTSWTPVPMACIATNQSAAGPWYRFKTTAGHAIPAQASDLFVKYAATCTYTGLHSEISNPSTNSVFGPYPYWLAPLDTMYGTNQAFYVVLSCPTGAVWINELNAQDLSDLYAPVEKYVELCGPANVSLNGWTLQILDTYGNTQDVYVVTNGFSFANTTNGFGFFVLGDTATAGRNMTLTNSFLTDWGDPFPPSALPPAGGIRLIRKSGLYAHAVSYALDPSYVTALTAMGFIYAGYDDYSLQSSLSLTGTGKTANAFSWINSAGYTIGQVNEAQWLQGSNSVSDVTPPTIHIIAFLLGTTNAWVECSGATNGWSPTPWASTNLANTNGWWRHLPFSSSVSGSNTYQLNFGRTNLSPCFYKIVVTNGL